MNALTPPPAVATGGFLDRYEAARDRLPGAGVAALAALREAAAAGFRATGLPTRRSEAFRYTDLAPIAGGAFAAPPESVEGVEVALPERRAPHRAVFVDGRFRADLSDLPAWAVPLRDAALTEGARRLSAEPGRAADLLNAMLFEDGLSVDVPPGEEAGSLDLVHVASGSGDGPVAFHPRHLVRLGAGASLTLIETATGPDASRHLHNPAFVVEVGEGARLAHVRVQREPAGAFHLAHSTVRVAAGGTYDGFALNAGARIGRHEVALTLDGPRATAHLDGAQLAGDGQTADVTTALTHAHPDCASRQTVKTVLAGRSRGVFQGKILVERVAQKTDGYQMNQALLLSERAEMDSKPQLEIYADDVKCSHGATVGALDEDALFYLRSRGVPAATARAMLVRAFLAEATEGVADEGARAALDAAVEAWWARHGDAALAGAGGA